MEPDEGGGGPSRSHPFVTERIRALRGQMASAEDEHLRVGAETYDEAIAGLLAVAAEVELKAGILDRAEASIARHLALRPESGRGHYLKAEHARLTAPEGRRALQVRLGYERAVELAPDDAEPVRALGLLYYSDGERPRAMALFERYLSLAPDAADRKLIERYLPGEDPTR
jgi:tetratricopeptide (TPR) repeat protein